MPRTARASVGGYRYHTLHRGNGRAQVFHDADDYPGFVRLLRPAGARVPMRRVGFCLMPNHFHLVLWLRGDGNLGLWRPGLICRKAGKRIVTEGSVSVADVRILWTGGG